jgi:hypothetical protein
MIEAPELRALPVEDDESVRTAAKHLLDADAFECCTFEA